MKSPPKGKAVWADIARQILNSSPRINFNWFNIINLDLFFLPYILSL